MSEQLSFISCRWPRAKAPKRVETLEVLQRVIPWNELENRLREHYQADARKTGRKGYSLRMMLRCLIVACVWNLSDEALENFVLDSLAIAKFIGTDPWQPRPPSASAFRNFRRLANSALGSESIRLVVDLAFIEAGIQWRQGCMVDPVFRRNPKNG